MIVSNNISPEKNLYYIGSLILNLLNDNANKLDILVLYERLIKINNIPFVLYTYALDWLFISSLIIIDKKGNVKKCL